MLLLSTVFMALTVSAQGLKIVKMSGGSVRKLLVK